MNDNKKILNISLSRFNGLLCPVNGAVGLPPCDEAGYVDAPRPPIRNGVFGFDSDVGAANKGRISLATNVAFIPARHCCGFSGFQPRKLWTQTLTHRKLFNDNSGSGCDRYQLTSRINISESKERTGVCDGKVGRERIGYVHGASV